MRSLSAAVSAVVIAMALAVQGEKLPADCPPADFNSPVCQTSLGSPDMNDCAEAIKQLSGTCRQSNGHRSLCTTLVTVRTCKIDVCGQKDSELYEGVNGGGYLQKTLNECHSGGRVGGKIFPVQCHVNYGTNGLLYGDALRLQFSHS